MAPHDLPLPGPTGGKTPLPSKTVLGKNPFYTTKAQAQAAIGPDERGVGVRFKAGKGYYLGNATKQAGGTLPPPPKKGPSYTAAQEATLHAQQLLAPQYKQAAADAKQQNYAINSYTAAVMQQLAGLAPSIGNDYTTAINSQQGLVDAAANSLKNANPNGSAQALLDAVGAPQSQHDAVSSSLANAFPGAAAVGQYAGGVLPLGSLSSQGLAAETLAKLQPGIEALSGRQSLLSALKNQSDARMQIAAQQPKLAQDWLNSFTSNKAKQQQLTLEAKALGLKTRNQNFNQNLAKAKLTNQQNEFIARQKTQIAEFNAKQTTAATKLANPNSSLSAKVGYLVDSSGKAILVNGKRQILPGFNTNAQGRVVKSKAFKSTQTAAAAFPNLTKTQVQRLRAGVNAARFGGPNRSKTPVTINGKIYQPGDQLPPVGYQEAIREAIAAGYSRAAATKMANRFYQPGQNGRPGRGNDSSGLGLTVPPPP